MAFLICACPCCGGVRLEGRAAMVAPFVAERAMCARPKPCRIYRCAECDALFYDNRLDDIEIRRLYSRYRGDDYLSRRHKWEILYTRSIYDRLGGPEEIAWRRDIYEQTVTPWINGSIETVLDYGGDRGQLIAGGPGRKYYVYEISGKPPLD